VSDYVKIIRADELAPGQGRTVQVGEQSVALFNVDGSFHAIDDTCPHANGPLGDGHVADCIVSCPLHHWEFDVRTGEYLDDPETKVATYEVKVEDGDVLVRV
jgi:NAD(P)H-dependent nitrite reductase small subunit